jgi:hypothetical protein
MPLDVPGPDLEIALRTHTPPSYGKWHLPLFLTASLGTPDAIENERKPGKRRRIYAAMPSISINLLLILAGIAAFALYRSQRSIANICGLGCICSCRELVPSWGLPAGRSVSAFGQLPVQRSAALSHRHCPNRVHFQLWRPARWAGVARV